MAHCTRLEISWILSFRVSTPYIIIPVTYNTYIAYIKANLIDLSDLVIISMSDCHCLTVLCTLHSSWWIVHPALAIVPHSADYYSEIFELRSECCVDWPP